VQPVAVEQDSAQHGAQLAAHDDWQLERSGPGVDKSGGLDRSGALAKSGDVAGGPSPALTLRSALSSAMGNPVTAKLQLAQRTATTSRSRTSEL